MTESTLNFNDFTPDDDTNNSRLLRMVLASIEGDLVQMTAVADETTRDEHGPDIATWSLVLGLATALGGEWVRQTGREATLSNIQKVLVSNAGEAATNGR